MDTNPGNNSANVNLSVTAAVRPVLVDIALSGTNFTFKFQSEAGKSYTVEFIDDLNGSNWMPLEVINGNGSLKQIITPAFTVPQRFFRVRQP